MFGFDREGRPQVKGGPIMTRRAAVRLLLGVGGGAGAVAVGGPAVAEWVDRAFIMTPEQRLEANKMPDFVSMYHAKKEFEAAYGEYIPYDDIYSTDDSETVNSEYWNIYSFMDFIADGRYDSQLFFEKENEPLSIFRDGWGDAKLHGTPEEIRSELKNRAQIAALHKLNASPEEGGVNIVIDKDVSSFAKETDPMGRKGYKIFLEQLVQLMPIQFLFGVHTIHIRPGDGGEMNNTNGGEINIGDASIYDALISADATLYEGQLDEWRSHAYVSGIHEFGHSTSIFFGGDNWDDNHISQRPSNYRSIGKQFMRRADYLHYLEVKMRGQKEVADAYFGMSWDKAQKFKGGTDPMIMGGANEQFVNWGKYAWEGVTNDSIASWEQDMTNSFGVHYDTIPNDKQSDISWRFNRYVHSVGSLLFHNPKLKDKIFSNDDMAFAMHRFFGEVQHYFVGPVQRKGLGLAGTAQQNRPVAEQSVLEQWNMRIEAARAKAFYNLPPHVVNQEDPIAVCQAIRDFFAM